MNFPNHSPALNQLTLSQSLTLNDKPVPIIPDSSLVIAWALGGCTSYSNDESTHELVLHTCPRGVLISNPNNLHPDTLVRNVLPNSTCDFAPTTVYTTENGTTISVDNSVRYTLDTTNYDAVDMADSIVQSYGASLLGEISFSNRRIATLSSVIDAISLSNALNQSPGILHASPGLSAERTMSNDPSFDDQYQLSNQLEMAYNYGQTSIDVNALNAWELVEAMDTTIIAFLDSGIDPHDEFNDGDNQSRLIIGYQANENFSGNYTDLSGYSNYIPPSEYDGGSNPAISNANLRAHGVACAGLATASENGNGIQGLSPESKIISANILTGNHHIGLMNDDTGAMIVAALLGAHLRSTNGFELEGNQFLGESMMEFGPPNQTTHGVIFDHLGPEANECYRNTFDNLDYGVYVDGKNGVGKAGTGDVFEGLQILCNEFGGTTDNLHDIYLEEGASIANAQGQPASGYSAGNEFSWLTGCQSGELTSDFTVLSSSPALSYYWNSAGGAQQEPLCYSEDKIASSEANGAPRTCESRIWRTRTKNMLLSEQSLMENLVDGAHDVYYNDVDNGDVPGLVSTIENPLNTSEQVRNAMIACIPDLSDEAFKAAFERSPAMDEWHLAQVLLLNSPLKPSVIDMMSVYGLDPFYRELVLDGQNGGITNMMILESEMAGFSTALSDAQQDYLRHITFGDTLGTSVPEHMNLATSMGATTRSSFISSGAAVLLGDTSAALATLANQESVSGLEDRLTWKQFELSWSGAAGDSMRFSSSELSQVEFESLQNESTSSGMAQAALRTVADDHFPLALNYGASSGKSNRQKPESDVVHPSSVFPNPVGDWSFITVHAPESVDRIQIEVRDEMGRVIQQDQLKGGVGYIPLSTAQMKRGVYLCSVFFDGIHVSTEKIIKL